MVDTTIRQYKDHVSLIRSELAPRFYMGTKKLIRELVTEDDQANFRMFLLGESPAFRSVLDQRYMIFNYHDNVDDIKQYDSSIKSVQTLTGDMILNIEKCIKCPVEGVLQSELDSAIFGPPKEYVNVDALNADQRKSLDAYKNQIAHDLTNEFYKTNAFTESFLKSKNILDVMMFVSLLLEKQSAIASSGDDSHPVFTLDIINELLEFYEKHYFIKSIRLNPNSELKIDASMVTDSNMNRLHRHLNTYNNKFRGSYLRNFQTPINIVHAMRDEPVLASRIRAICPIKTLDGYFTRPSDVIDALVHFRQLSACGFKLIQKVFVTFTRVVANGDQVFDTHRDTTYFSLDQYKLEFKHHDLASHVAKFLETEYEAPFQRVVEVNVKTESVILLCKTAEYPSMDTLDRIDANSIYQTYMGDYDYFLETINLHKQRYNKNTASRLLFFKNSIENFEGDIERCKEVLSKQKITTTMVNKLSSQRSHIFSIAMRFQFNVTTPTENGTNSNDSNDMDALERLLKAKSIINMNKNSVSLISNVFSSVMNIIDAKQVHPHWDSVQNILRTYEVDDIPKILKLIQRVNFNGRSLWGSMDYRDFTITVNTNDLSTINRCKLMGLKIQTLRYPIQKSREVATAFNN